VCGCTSTSSCAGKCGKFADNCGVMVDCGTTQCGAPDTCGGGGTPNVCGCRDLTTPTCDADRCPLHDLVNACGVVVGSCGANCTGSAVCCDAGAGGLSCASPLKCNP
jgi:hypothetical protein